MPSRRHACDRDAPTSSSTTTITPPHLAVRSRALRRCSPSRDTGIGMDAETQAPHLRAVLHDQGPGKGTGLGLATVYGIVKQSGGYIWLDSEPGDGTTFNDLPAARDGCAVKRHRGAAARPRPRDGDRSCSSRTSVVRVARRHARAHGYTRARGAANRARRSSSRRPRPVDLLLTDVVMPGMSGRELARALVGVRRPSSKVLYMSGYHRRRDVHGGRLDPGGVSAEAVHPRRAWRDRARSA